MQLQEAKAPEKQIRTLRNKTLKLLFYRKKQFSASKKLNIA